MTSFPAGVTGDAAVAAGAFLRVAGDGERAVLERAAAAAIALGEAFTGTAFFGRTFETILAAGTAWQPLPAAPVTAIAGVTALPDGAAPFVLAGDAYATDIDRDGTGWVRLTATVPAARVAVSYSAGLAATWDTLPAPLAQGVVALAAHLFEQRDAKGGGGEQPPAAVAALWRPWRRMRLMELRA